MDLNRLNWSYSIWVKYQSLDKNVHSLLLGLSSSCNPWGGIPLSIQNTSRSTGGETREIVINSENGKLSIPITDELVGKWNLFTVTVENKRCIIYQNGVLVGTMSSPIEFFASSNPYYVSQAPHMFQNDGPLVYLDAIVDNIRFYDRALNRQEVYELYKTKK